ncbi:hypothetical protein HDU67_009577 [Dinochytrium kinnereticum]|nr:hypothetical protein HDU67_009577 [Dinochytrium kinnereticum]
MTANDRSEHTLSILVWLYLTFSFKERDIEMMHLRRLFLLRIQNPYVSTTDLKYYATGTLSVEEVHLLRSLQFIYSVSTLTQKDAEPMPRARHTPKPPQYPRVPHPTKSNSDCAKPKDQHCNLPNRAKTAPTKPAQAPTSNVFRRLSAAPDKCRHHADASETPHSHKPPPPDEFFNRLAAPKKTPWIEETCSSSSVKPHPPAKGVPQSSSRKVSMQVIQKLSTPKPPPQPYVNPDMRPDGIGGTGRRQKPKAKAVAKGKGPKLEEGRSTIDAVIANVGEKSKENETEVDIVRESSISNSRVIQPSENAQMPSTRNSRVDMHLENAPKPLTEDDSYKSTDEQVASKTPESIPHDESPPCIGEASEVWENDASEDWAAEISKPANSEQLRLSEVVTDHSASYNRLPEDPNPNTLDDHAKSGSLQQFYDKKGLVEKQVGVTETTARGAENAAAVALQDDVAVMDAIPSEKSEEQQLLTSDGCLVGGDENVINATDGSNPQVLETVENSCFVDDEVMGAIPSEKSEEQQPMTSDGGVVGGDEEVINATDRSDPQVLETVENSCFVHDEADHFDDEKRFDEGPLKTIQDAFGDSIDAQEAVIPHDAVKEAIQAPEESFDIDMHDSSAFEKQQENRQGEAVAYDEDFAIEGNTLDNVPAEVSQNESYHSEQGVNDGCQDIAQVLEVTEDSIMVDGVAMDTVPDESAQNVRDVQETEDMHINDHEAPAETSDFQGNSVTDPIDDSTIKDETVDETHLTKEHSGDESAYVDDFVPAETEEQIMANPTTDETSTGDERAEIIDDAITSDAHASRDEEEGRDAAYSENLIEDATSTPATSNAAVLEGAEYADEIEERNVEQVVEEASEEVNAEKIQAKEDESAFEAEETYVEDFAPDEFAAELGHNESVDVVSGQEQAAGPIDAEIMPSESMPLEENFVAEVIPNDEAVASMVDTPVDGITEPVNGGGSSDAIDVGVIEHTNLVLSGITAVEQAVEEVSDSPEEVDKPVSSKVNEGHPSEVLDSENTRESIAAEAVQCITHGDSEAVPNDAVDLCNIADSKVLEAAYQTPQKSGNGVDEPANTPADETTSVANDPAAYGDSEKASSITLDVVHAVESKAHVSVHEVPEKIENGAADIAAVGITTSEATEPVTQGNVEPAPGDDPEEYTAVNNEAPNHVHELLEKDWNGPDIADNESTHSASHADRTGDDGPILSNFGDSRISLSEGRADDKSTVNEAEKEVQNYTPHQQEYAEESLEGAAVNNEDILTAKEGYGTEADKSSSEGHKSPTSGVESSSVVNLATEGAELADNENNYSDAIGEHSGSEDAQLPVSNMGEISQSVKEHAAIDYHAEDATEEVSALEPLMSAANLQGLESTFAPESVESSSPTPKADESVQSHDSTYPATIEPDRGDKAITEIGSSPHQMCFNDKTTHILPSTTTESKNTIGDEQLDSEYTEDVEKLSARLMAEDTLNETTESIEKADQAAQFEGTTNVSSVSKNHTAEEQVHGAPDEVADTALPQAGEERVEGSDSIIQLDERSLE